MKLMIKLFSTVFWLSLCILVQQPVEANFGKPKHLSKLFDTDETDLSIILDSQEISYCETLLGHSNDKCLKHFHPLKKLFLKKEAKKKTKHMKLLKKLLKKKQKGKRVVELHHYKYPVQHLQPIKYSYPSIRYHHQPLIPYAVPKHYAKSRPSLPHQSYHSYHSTENSYHNFRPMPQYYAPKPHRRPTGYLPDSYESCDSYGNPVEYDPCLAT